MQERSLWDCGACPMLSVCSWSSHPALSVLWSALRYIRRVSPRGGVLENVMGLGIPDKSESGDENKGALDMILEELQTLKYATSVEYQNLDKFHACVRRRTPCCHKLNTSPQM